MTKKIIEVDEGEITVRIIECIMKQDRPAGLTPEQVLERTNSALVERSINATRLVLAYLENIGALEVAPVHDSPKTLQ